VTQTNGRPFRGDKGASESEDNYRGLEITGAEQGTPHPPAERQTSPQKSKTTLPGWPEEQRAKITALRISVFQATFRTFPEATYL